MDRIVIEFAADTAGLEPAIIALTKLGVLSEDELASFRQSNEEFRRRQQIIQQTQGPMDKLAASAKNAAANLSNGATNKAIQDLTKLVNELTQKVEQLEKKNESQGNKSNNVFRAMKKEINELVAAAKEAYAANNKMLGDELMEKAGKLSDDIGDIRAQIKAYASDTAVLDSVAQGVTAIGAGFQIAQGAQALFGDGNEDLQKTLVKVQATMALVNGLTQIQNALQKESALRIGLSNAARFIENALARVGITIKTVEVATKQADNAASATGEVITKRRIVVQAIENALNSQSVIVRGLATAAQWALNAAMDANPIGLLILAIFAVVGAFALFSDAAEDAAEKQIMLNKVQLDAIEGQNAVWEFMKQRGQDREAGLQREIDKMKAQGASTDEIRQKEIKLAEERKRNAEAEAKRVEDDVKNLGANREAVARLSVEYAKLKIQKDSSKSDDYDKEIESIEGQIKVLNELISRGAAANDEQINASADLTNKELENQRILAEEGLKSRKASLEGKLKFAKQGSEQQYALEKALAQATYDLEISNVNLTAGEKEKIYADYIDRIRQIDEAYQRMRLQDELSGTNARLAGTRKGSQQEFDLKVRALEIQRQIELTNSKLTENQKLEIVANSQRKIADLTSDFLRKQRADQLNSLLLINDARLQLIEKGTADELKLRKERILIQQQLEIESIDKDLQGTEIGEAKKNDIIAKYTAESIKLQQDYTAAILQQQQERSQQTSDYLGALADIEARSINTSFERRQQIERDKFALRNQRLEEQQAIETQRYADGIISYEEYQRRLTDIAEQQLLSRAELEETINRQQQEALERDVQKRYEIYSQALKLVADAEKVASDNRILGYEQELAALQEQRDNQIITEEEYNSRKKAIDQRIKQEKQDAARKEKEFAVLQILLDTQVAAVKALGTPPAPNFLMFGLTESFGILQAGIAAARKIPQFYKGTENAPPGWAWVGERGPELMWMQGGEKIKPHEESVRMSNHFALNLPALNDSVIGSMQSMPKLNERAIEQMLVLGSEGVSIDYEKLASLVGRQFEAAIQLLPLTHFSFDKNGFRASVSEGESHTLYLNDRYSSL